jgi:glutamyl-tRNA synthetase
MSDQPVRVRFAPSPTGPLHIGGLRTALYNYIYAKNRGGTFILRVEDTDRGRYVPGAEDYIIDSLNWTGLEFDEGPGVDGPHGPYRQSERKDIYRKYVEKLISEDRAYYAFDTREELEEMRNKAEQEGKHGIKYGMFTRLNMRNSLTLSKEETSRLMEDGVPFTVRLKVEHGPEVVFEDVVRGRVSFESSELDDKILLKADGMPTYHLANVVDDYLMRISHVIRGEEWLSSTAHHVLLYRAFGWEDSIPVFAHLPLILKPTGKGKLSKRDGQKFGFPVFPLAWNGNDERFPGFREYGFEPEALLNFLAFLGWNPGDEREIFSLEELVKAFSLENVVKSGARFDWQKALWFNQQHLMTKSVEDLIPRVRYLLESKGIDVSEFDLEKYIQIMQPRVTTLIDFYDAGRYFFHEVEAYDRKMIRKKFKEPITTLLEPLAEVLSEIEPWKSSKIREHVNSFIEQNNLKFGDLLPVMRLALAGTTKGPDLFDMCEIMGREIVVERIRNAGEVFMNEIAET